MTYTRYGRCAQCSRPTTEQKEIVETIDMFEPDANGLRSDVVEQLKKWRETDILCDEHKVMVGASPT